jgi:hypothetical protein
MALMNLGNYARSGRGYVAKHKWFEEMAQLATGYAPSQVEWIDSEKYESH